MNFVDSENHATSASQILILGRNSCVEPLHFNIYFFGEDDDDDGDDYDDVDIDDDLDLVTKLLQNELNCFRKNLNLTEKCIFFSFSSGFF